MDYISIACWTSPSHGPSRGFIPWGLIPLAFAERFSTLEQIRCAGSQRWVRRPWKEQDRDGRFHHSIIPSAQMEEFVSGGIMCILYIYIYTHCIYIYTYRSFGISFLGGATPEEHAHRSRSWVELGSVVVGAYHWEARVQYNCRSFYIIPNRGYTQFHEAFIGNGLLLGLPHDCFSS